jgi:hypothetical protein
VKKLTKRVKSGAKSTALARVGDPLITATGGKIDPEGYASGRPVKSEPPAMVLDAETFRPLKKRTLRELPAEVSLINGVGAIFMYTLLGVGDREIADALKTTVVQIEEVRRHTAYKECFDIIVAEFINKNSDLLAARVAAYSHSALDVVGSIAMNGKKEETKLRASIDLLDRAGVKPKDVEARNNASKSNELRIVVVKGNQGDDLRFDIGVDEDQRVED